MQALVKGLGVLSKRVLYRQEKRGVGAKGWSVKFRLSLGDFLYDCLSFI